MTQQTATKRPTLYDPAVVRAAVDELSPLISQRTQVPDAEVKRHLIHVLSHSTLWDGYDLSRRLEDFEYQPDAEFVQILDRAYPVAVSVLDRVVRDWVRTADLKPQFRVGDPVVIYTEQGDPKDAGSVAEINAATGQYQVVLSRGDGNGQPPISVVNFERVGPPKAYRVVLGDGYRAIVDGLGVVTLEDGAADTVGVGWFRQDGTLWWSEDVPVRIRQDVEQKLR